MVNKEQQIKNSFTYLLPTITTSFLPFLTIPIFTRILTKEDYGVFALAQVYAIFVSGLANFGMTAAYERDYFQYRDDPLRTAKLLYSVLLFVMLNFLLLAGLTYVFRGTLSKLIIGSPEYGNILFWAFCAYFFYSVNYYYLTYFKNSETARDFVAYTIVGTLINLIISFFLVAYLRIGVIGLIYAQLFSGATIFGSLSYKFTTSLPFSLNMPILTKSLQIAYPLTPRIFLGVIGTQFDKYMIGLLASVGGVGIYSIGQRISYIIFTYMTAIENVFSPQVYKRMFDLQDKGGTAIGKYLTPFAYISIFLALLVALFSEEIISILTPPSFHGAIDIVAVLSMYYGLLFFGKLNGPQLIFTKKTHITSLLTMGRIGINVGLNIPFIMRWGAIGAAWATLLAGLISGTISFFVAQHYYEIKWEYTRIGSIFLTFFGAAILMILLRDAGVTYYIRVAIKLMSVCVYFYTGVKAGIITTENLTLVKNILVGSSLQTAKRKTTY
jgi:O-antigen/teichoic acid export membrane protein